MKNLFLIAAIIATISAEASGTFSMIEINPLHGTTSQGSFTDSAKTFYGAGELTGFTEMNGRLYFVAQSSEGNDELWSTDGTQDGTSLVKEINPTAGSSIGNLVKVGNRILFMATDNGSDWDLWSTNGTNGGTMKVEELNQWSNTALSPQNISLMGNRLLFCTQDKLMISDGTTIGTDSLLSIASYSQGFGYCELNNKVYFLLPNFNTGQQEIWRTDGSTAGTQLMINLHSSACNISSVSEMAAFDGKIYLSGAPSGQGNDLFTFDGNVNGVVQKIELATGGNSYPGNFTLFDGAFYFYASTFTSANMFRITTGNSTPQELIQNAAFGWLTAITFANNSIYFLSEDQQKIHRINLNTLSHTVSILSGYTMPGYFSTPTNMLTGIGGKIYFAAYDSITNNQVFMSADEDLQNVTQIMPNGSNTMHPFNFLFGCGTADIFDFFVWGDKIMVPANFNDAGRELWVFKTDAVNGVAEIKNESAFILFPNPASGEITVKSANNGYCDQQLSIVNVNGEIVLQKKLSGTANSFNISQLSAGNYFATIAENGKATGTKKLVLAK